MSSFMNDVNNQNESKGAHGEEQQVPVEEQVNALTADTISDGGNTNKDQTGMDVDREDSGHHHQQQVQQLVQAVENQADEETDYEKVNHADGDEKDDQQEKKINGGTNGSENTSTIMMNGNGGHHYGQDKNDKKTQSDRETTTTTTTTTTNHNNEVKNKNGEITTTTENLKGEQNQKESTGEDATDTRQSKAQDATAATAPPSTSVDEKSATPPVEPALPVLKGTLSYISNELTRRHIIRGMWNFESSSEHAPQRFELVRTLGPEEDPTELPKDGVFDGSFNLAYVHVSTKGKRKERSKVITESGVNIKFTERHGEDDSFNVKGEGTNQYGIFSLFGIATRDREGSEKKYTVELRKRYLTSPVAVAISPSNKDKATTKKRKLETISTSIPEVESSTIAVDEPLPDPSEPYPSNVVCLRGKIEPSSSAQDGVVHRVSGMWSSGLDNILADPENKRGLCNEFEYEYRGTFATDEFPISGKYTGWFNLTDGDGTRNRIPERDVTLKFKKNNAGFYNVEGKGFNMFGKYNITGTLDKDNIITIFRHFQVSSKKPKKAAPPAVVQPPEIVSEIVDSDSMVLADVKVLDSDEVEQLVGPEDGHYAALSRGVLRLNSDGVISCTGKWALTRTHFNNGLSSPFTFGLEEHHAKSADGSIHFPVDSANYKGSFKMKRGTTKLQSVIDKQIVMKFRKNIAGSYNVYGKGVNSYGTFDLVGTLILHGQNSGHIELYRIYEAPLESTEPQVSKQPGKVLPTAKNAVKKGSVSKGASAFTPVKPEPSLMRRESSRAIKLPSRLEDDELQGAGSNIMEKCNAILKQVREKDLLGGSFFAEPVDPVAHGIPTYHQIITNPMDLGTVQAKMDANEIESPEEFARLMRLIFDNAIKFNVDPGHIVHQAARNLLTLFNSKFRDIDRSFEKKKPTKKELKEQKKKQQEELKRLEHEKKFKREEEEDPTLRMIRVMHSSCAEVEKNLAALNSLTATNFRANVTRDEFNLQSNILQHLSTQVLQLQGLIVTLIPAAGKQHVSAKHDATPVFKDSSSSQKKTTKKKKPKVEKTKPAVVEPAAPVPAPAPRKSISEIPLTLEEQQELTDFINTIAMAEDERLEEVIDIIRESAAVNGDEEEIDLEIDLLPTSTQRKLLNFVNKNKPKAKKGKKPTTKKKSSTPTPAPVSKPSLAPKQKAKSNDSFFAFGTNEDDSDSDEDEAVLQKHNDSKGFHINEDAVMEDEDEENDDIVAAKWNISKPVEADTNNEEDDEDDAWEAARGASAAQKAFDMERQAREQKILQEAEEAKQKALEETKERGKKLQEERKAKEAEEARLRKQKEKEERERAQKAREQALENLKEIKPTVDLEGQRDFMKDYEQSFYDKDFAGGASPSSDFGF
mmetsp:Transcript_7110/g.13449  ORF Transcript_7110/g.13449 Transcript_7110/m.13449 type:complete len:1377 (+) Transcript_7110:406-4536(+)